MRIVQRERTGSRAQQESGTAEGGADIAGESQGGGGHTLYRAAISAGRLGQVEVPALSREDVSDHGFWKQGDHCDV